MFLFFQLLFLIIGLIAGIYFGGSYFGWLGGIIGGFFGAVLGFFILGRIPLLLGFLFLRDDLKKCDNLTLKKRLETQYYISHLIIAELASRGELVEQFRDYIFSQLQSDNFNERDFGWQNLNVWFPELAAQIESFDPTSPTNKSMKKIALLRKSK